MVERQDFLDRHLAATGFVKSSCDGAICTFANGMQKLVIIAWDRQRSDESIDDSTRDDLNTDLELGERLGILARGHSLRTPETSR